MVKFENIKETSLTQDQKVQLRMQEVQTRSNDMGTKWEKRVLEDVSWKMEYWENVLEVGDVKQ